MCPVTALRFVLELGGNEIIPIGDPLMQAPEAVTLLVPLQMIS